jgi:hypothetical protein
MTDFDPEFERFMDATQTVITLKAGQVLTQEQVAEIQFVSEYERRDHEHSIDVFHKGFEAGRLSAADEETVALLEKIDALKTKLAVAEGLLRFYAKKKEKKPGGPLRARFEGQAET